MNGRLNALRKVGLRSCAANVSKFMNDAENEA